MILVLLSLLSCVILFNHPFQKLNKVRAQARKAFIILSRYEPPGGLPSEIKEETSVIQLATFQAPEETVGLL